MMTPSASAAGDGISAGDPSDPSPVRAALASWTAFNLTDRRRALDRTAQSFVDAKETAAAARKQLGEMTKTLKRAVKSVEGENTAENVSNVAAASRGTIKRYQQEIDTLTRRCKAAEGSFSKLYHDLHECADPAVVLERALNLVEGRQGQVANLLVAVEELNRELEEARNEHLRLEEDATERERELAEARAGGGDDGGGGAGGALSLAEREELIRLRGEVAEYEVEFRGLKNQDITIRKLESKIEELEENKEEEIQKELKKAQEDLAESEGRRATDALEREAATARRLESVELQLRAERAGREASASQLLSAEDGAGEREAAWGAQRGILVQDAERLREVDGLPAIRTKISSDLLSACKGSWKVWPLVHAINFRFIPNKFRLFYINAVQIGFNIFLSIIGTK